MSEKNLFEPIRVGPYSLSNRMVMAAMTRNRAPGEIPGDLMVDYYAQRASAGLLIAESTAISEEGIGWHDTPGIYTPAQVAGWKRVTDAVHAKGGHIFLQFWHCGRCAHHEWRPGKRHPVAPSAIQSIGTVWRDDGSRVQHSMPRALELAEIAATLQDYRQAAKNAMGAGFDGVEVHAANGYLIDQFLQDASNQRTDHYGGAVENRCRLLWEAIEAVAETWGEQRVGVHISPTNVHHGISDSDPETLFAAVAEGLNRYGLAYVNVVEGPTDPTEKEIPFDWDRLRRRLRHVYIANNNYDLAKAQAAVRSGHADMVSFGRLFIANPDLVERFRRNAPLNPLRPESIIGPGAVGLTDYPFLAA